MYCSIEPPHSVQVPLKHSDEAAAASSNLCKLSDAICTARMNIVMAPPSFLHHHSSLGKHTRALPTARSDNGRSCHFLPRVLSVAPAPEINPFVPITIPDRPKKSRRAHTTRYFHLQTTTVTFIFHVIISILPMALPINSYHLHHPSITPSDCEPSHLFPKPKSASSSPNQTNQRQRAYWHIDISYVQVNLQFVSLPSRDLKILRPIIAYYWWPRKVLVHERIKNGANTMIFDLSVKRGKSWDTQDIYLAKRDLVRLQLEIFRALHGRGWMFQRTAGYTVEQPGLGCKSSIALPSSCESGIYLVLFV